MTTTVRPSVPAWAVAFAGLDSGAWAQRFDELAVAAGRADAMRAALSRPAERTLLVVAECTSADAGK